MLTKTCLVAMTLAACGASQRNPALPRPAGAAASAALRCPPGTTAMERGSADNGVHERWCEMADGTREGRYQQTAGVRQELGAFHQGERDGRWDVYMDGAPLKHVTYARGVAAGACGNRQVRGYIENGLLVGEIYVSAQQCEPAWFAEPVDDRPSVSGPLRCRGGVFLGRLSQRGTLTELRLVWGDGGDVDPAEQKLPRPTIEVPLVGGLVDREALRTLLDAAAAESPHAGYDDDSLRTSVLDHSLVGSKPAADLANNSTRDPSGASLARARASRSMSSPRGAR
jgi:hypothetical protein